MAGGVALAERPIHEGKQVLGHGDVEMAALAGLRALGHRQEDVHHRRIGGAGDVGDQRRRHHRLLARAHRQRQQAGIADVIEIVGGDVALRPGLAVAGDRTIDEARIDLGDAVVIEAEARHDAGAELLDQDVGARQQGIEPGAVGRVLQIERQALLAAIEQRETDAVLAPMRGIVAHVLAAGTFDLEHLGAGLGQQQGRHRPRQQRGEIQNQNALQRSQRLTLTHFGHYRARRRWHCMSFPPNGHVPANRIGARFSSSPARNAPPPPARAPAARRRAPHCRACRHASGR